MASSLHHLPALIFLISFFSILLHSSSALPRHRFLPSPAEELNAAADSSAETFFEVSRPINHPKVKPCSYRVLEHDFASTYGKSPVLASYAPPNHCSSSEFSSIVLEWKATSKGRQFDRIFGVWLGGVELLRSCTAEPRPNGIVWKVEKDITKYYSILMANQTLAVYIGNIVDKTYTGVYHVDITIHFYPSVSNGVGANLKGDSAYGDGKWADLILPISRSLPLNDGLWFEVENSTDFQTKKFAIPPNVYRAVLEVYVSFHENDESWYSNLPNEYLKSNNLSGWPGNGPFREVVVSLDGGVIGAVWPFTVIYTGGVNPLLWRPISAIGSFDLPTYDIQLTPFLGKLLDGKTHEIGFSVTNALNVWYVDANLHLWLDKKRSRTKGRLLSREAPPLSFTANSDCKGLNGKLITEASRSVSSTGWVMSSYGKIITSSNQQLSYANHMVMEKNGSLQTVNQTIYYDTSVFTKKPFIPAHIVQHSRRFPLYMSSDQVNQAGDDHAYALVANITMGFDESRISGSEATSLRNLQNAEGNMVVKGNLVQSGVGSTQQVYKFDSTREPCYYRSVGSSNYTILYDNVRTGCSSKSVHSAGLSSRFDALH